jgi:hypothetical protein
MRSTVLSQKWLILFACSALVGVGCAHKEQQAENKDAPKATAPTPVPTVAKQSETPTTKEKSSDSGGGTRIECTAHNESRIIENRAKDSGCELAYTKSGEESIVASSGNGMSYCEKAFEKLKDKLTAAGYECK